ncbi:hypothetical protein AYJ54_33105 [Bradyrhizobium centrolobii]|uniref:Uncharacterized protein n=1 Tax=Bradyrhizobium centrolobii TaxID=1505087 RepID=A0A176Y8C7_9BRAD|nr:DUF3237 family protein [Bradyrhizobium centrolobii]OAE99596.1 hypothetical protein AYJ54_33105 [Bradyrhizobium centrolobii]
MQDEDAIISAPMSESIGSTRARLILETNDNDQIYAAWTGLRHGPKEVMERLYQGEIVDPRAYYFRTTPYFETSSEKYS